MYPNDLTSPQDIEPMPQVQPQLQPVKPEMDPRVRNTIIYCVVTGSIIVFGIIGIVLLLVFGRTKVSGGPSVPEKVPTPELSQSVCEEYGGEFNTREGNSSNLIAKLYTYCETDDFSYNLDFFEENIMNMFRSELMRFMIVYPQYESMIVLENSDNLVKVYGNLSIYYTMYLIAYNDVALDLKVYGEDFNAEELLVKLGFPDRNRIENYDSSNPNTLINTDYPSEPSIEVAKEVCERYDGKFMDGNEARSDIASYFGGYTLAGKVCERFTNIDDELDPDDFEISPIDFEYYIETVDSDKMKEHWQNRREQILNDEVYQDTTKYSVLEDSDESLKACKEVTVGLLCVGLYDNTEVYIIGGNANIINHLFAELGFPDRARLEDYANTKSAESDS